MLERISAAIVRHGFNVGLVIASLATLSIGLALVWRGNGPAVKRSMLPPVPKKAIRRAVALRKARLTRRRTQLVSQLVKDAKAFGARFEPKLFSKPFPHFYIVANRKLPADGGRLETEHLRITTQVKKLAAATGTKRDHILVTVENRTDKHLAFRVQTQPSGKIDCSSKAVVPHSGLVIAPRATLTRSECLAESGQDFIDVGRIDVVEIPALSYHYLIKIRPVSLGMEKRLSTGHTAPRTHTRCANIPRSRIGPGKATWADVIDFYARFNCDVFDFPRGFKRPGKSTPQAPVKLVWR